MNSVSRLRALKILVTVLSLQAAVATAAQGLTLITPTNTTWRYFTNGTDPGTEWSAPAFDDSSWPQGRGLFGNDSGYPYSFNTFIPGPAMGGPLTVYFRTHFSWNGSSAGTVLTGTNYVDDGCVVFLNGVEITRFNMPGGQPTFETTAPEANPGGYPNLTGGEPVQVHMLIPLDSLTNGNTNPLLNGDNVLAVEVHNAGTGSSDVVFGLSLSTLPDFFCFPDGIQPTNRTVLEGHSTTFAVDVPVPCFPVLTLQWYRNVGAGEELIAGATTNAYTLTNAQENIDEGVYYCRVSDSLGTVDSRQARLTILPDLEHPTLTFAQGADGATVTLRFSKPLLAASAENLDNYIFTPSLAVSNAALFNESTSATVTLTTAPRELGANYVLHIANLHDTRASANPIDPNPTLVALTTARVLIPWDADGWRYNTNNLDATPDWKNPGFAPGPDWGTGRGLFGAESSSAVLEAAPAPIATPLAPNSATSGDALVTTCFRRLIDLPPLPAGARYVICHYTDDGFIAYLDGMEIHRFAMPAGAVAFTTRSTGIPTGDATFRSFTFKAMPGLHTLAVELHQAGASSDDVLFAMEVRMADATSPTLSIARTVNGGATFNWNADSNWRLRSATALTGPYLDVAIPVGSRLGTFTLPSVLAGHGFFLLDYTGQP